MPKKSQKRQCVEFLMENAVLRIQEYYDAHSSDEEDSEIDEIWDDLNEDLLLVLTKNCATKTRVDDMQFNMRSYNIVNMLGVNKVQFEHILALIEIDTTFSQICTQYSAEKKLAVGLYRLRNPESTATIGNIRKLFNIETAESVALMTQHVFAAILKLLSKYLHWPSEAERLEIISETFEELPFCIGYIGCTEIRLTEAPLINPNMYTSTNHGYAIKVQIVCDYKLRIRNVVIGNPGTLREEDVLENCEIFRSKKHFFSSKEWIAAGSNYPLTKTIITPFKPNTLEPTDEEVQIFNEKHRKYRSRVERCFRKLKQRFCSLHGLGIPIKDKESLTLCNQWVLVCCILHNILLSGATNGNESDLAIADTDAEKNYEVSCSEHTSGQAHKKRRTICQLLSSQSKE